jgi:hypothetical protein
MDQQFQTQLWQPKQVHRNLTERVVIRPEEIIWYPTPYSGIWFSCFEADSQVQEHPLTMLTRFDPGSFFPSHSHPDGEEILVLQGSFADETGHYAAGSYLLNPEGFSHVPYSTHGCITFVKLRQHGGSYRKHIKADINNLPWLPSLVPQIQIKLLYKQAGFSETVWIERWQPETALQVRESVVKEMFVLKGVWLDELGEYPTGTWLRYPPGCYYTRSSQEGCILYVKTYPLLEDRFNYHCAA